MDMPAISELIILDRDGHPVAAPLEWEPATILLPVAPDDWTRARLTVQGAPTEVSLRLIDGRACVAAEWPRRGAGQWRCVLMDGDRVVVDRHVHVSPAKLDGPSLERLLDDIDRRLVGSIAIALDRMGAFAGLREKPRLPGTIAEEFERLRRAALGDDSEPGVIQALECIARNPHSVLLRTHAWRTVERARAPVATRLAESMRSAVNAPAMRHGPAAIERVWNAESERTVDVFENRLLKFFAVSVSRRLRFLMARADRLTNAIESLLGTLEAACTKARFLEEVGDLRSAPAAPSMVLMRRPEYRWAYRRWLEFLRSARLTTDFEPRSAPIENVPLLYEVWASLVVIETALEVAEASGWHVHRQDLLRHRDGWFADLNWSGRIIIELTRADGEYIRVSPQRRFHRKGKPWRSLSFPQVPDLVIEIGRDGGPSRMLVFDPKYKLASEFAAPDVNVQAETDTSVLASAGRPAKIDIDKMHAYRDAIRSIEGASAVTFAAILYPGTESLFYGRDIAAFAARPLTVNVTKRELASFLHGFVAP